MSDRKMTHGLKKYRFKPPKRAGQDIYKELEKQEKKKHRERETLLEQLAGQVSLPADMVAGVPVVTLTGRNEIIIENYKGILEYTDSVIRIQAKLFCICIEGKRLEIAYFTNEEMKITGVIHSLFYR